MSNRRERAAELVLLIHYKLRLIRLFHIIIKYIISVIAEFFSLSRRLHMAIHGSESRGEHLLVARMSAVALAAKMGALGRPWHGHIIYTTR